MSEKLKICQLCNVGFALDKLLLPLINAQLKCGHNVISVCTKDEYSKRLKDSGYKVEFISIVRGINPLSHMYTIWKIFCFLRGENFDLIHVHTPVAALLGRIAAWLCGVPLVVYTAHGFYFHNDMSKIKKAFFIGLERFSGRITDLLFTQSGEDAKTAVIEGISSIDRVFAIGNGVDVNIFNLDLNVNNKIREQVRDELNIPEHAFLVGMIGRQVKEKGILELLKAAEVLIDKYVDIYFLIVGDRLASDHAAGVNIEVQKLSGILGKRLILTGMRSDIPRLLLAMDLFTLPSWREGMPRTIIEAMMMGLPVVATDIRGSREEVVDKITGLLVPVKDYKALKKAIELLYKDREKCKEMGGVGRHRALELYDEHVVIEKQLNLISKFWRIKNNNETTI